MSNTEDYVLGTTHHDSYKLGGPHAVTRIHTSGSHVHIGDMTFERGEFTRAFEGAFQTGLAPAPSRKFANPVPIGVATFSLALFCLSLVNVRARGVSNAAALAGLFWFAAGFIELCAAMWCVVIENTWAATLLGSFAGFWISYGCIVTDTFGIISTYGEKTSSLLAIWVFAWAIFTLGMWLTTLRSTWPLSMLILFVFLILVLLSAAQFCSLSDPSSSLALTKAGGYLGIITSVLAWFIMYEGLCTKENSYWVPPVLLMPGAITN